MTPKLLIFLILNVLLIFSQNCPSTERGPTIEQTKAYYHAIDAVLSLNKEILDLQAKCLSDPFYSVVSFEFSNGRCYLEREVKESVSRFFEPVVEAEAASCFKIREDDDVLPEDRYFNLSKIIEGFRPKNPLVFDDLLKVWRKALEEVRTYYKDCNNKDHILEHSFFKTYGPGLDTEEVVFTPKNPALSTFSFKHQFVKPRVAENQSNERALAVAGDDRLIPTPLSDLLKFVDSHFVAKVIQSLFTAEEPKESPTVYSHEENPKGAEGFQLIHQKAGFLYKTLDTLRIRLNLVGNLTLFVFDGSRRLRESVVIRKINTTGQWGELWLSELNIAFGDKDILLLDYEGVGAFGLREFKSDVEQIITSKNLMTLNKYIYRDQFSKPRTGQQYDILNHKNALDATVYLTRGEGKKSKAPKVEIVLESA